MSVYKKLQDARIKLQAMKLTKSGHNKFAGYQYFELGDFLPEVNSIFAELGLCSVVSFGVDLATLRVVDCSDGTEVVFTSPMAEANLKGCHPIQNLGAVETYSRRYLYVTALEIVEHDALDATSGKDQPASAKPVTKDVWDNLPIDEQTFLQDIATESIRMIDEGNVSDAVSHIDAQKLDADEKVALWSRFDSKQRTAIKKAAKPSAADFINTP